MCSRHWFVVAAVLLSGCTPNPFEAIGDAIRCDFSIHPNRCGAWGCASIGTQPIAAGGAKVFAKVFGPDDALDRVLSTDPEVVEVELGPIAGCERRWSLTLTSGVAGAADLVFLSASGAPLDRFRVEVRDATTFTVERWWQPPERLWVVAGSTHLLHFDTPGLIGTGAVHAILQGNLALGESPAELHGDVTSLFGDSVIFLALTPGEGLVRASTSGATLDIPVTVIATSDLTDATIEPSVLRIGQGNAGGVKVSARSGAATVYGVACAWRTSAGLEPPTRSAFVGSIPAPSAVYVFDASHTAPGSYTATCTLREGLVASVTVVVSP